MKHESRRQSIAAALLLAMLCAVGANSLPANAGIISAGTQIFNLDFTADLPYSAALISFSASPFTEAAGQIFSVQDFPELNAGGTMSSSFTATGPNSFTSLAFGVSETDAGFLDGLFSVRIALNTGSLNFDSLTASVLNSAGQVIATETLTPRAVPEPATLALLGLALAGIGFSRRKRGRQ